MRNRGRRNSFSKIFRSSVTRSVSAAKDSQKRAARVISVFDAMTIAADNIAAWANWYRENPAGGLRALTENLYDLGEGLKEISDLASEAEDQGESGSSGTGQPGPSGTA